ncbi:MAG: DegV family protein [Acidimicrobiales bacterium]
MKVVTDSSCDLPREVVERLGITVVPLTIRFGSEEFVDGRDLSTQEFWKRCGAASTLPETAAPSPGAFEEAFRAAASDGAEGVVCICLSSKLSATIQSAELASQAVAETVPVRVVDSLTVSLGLGLLAVLGAEVAAAGKGLDDVVGAVNDVIPRLRLIAALDTLDNLRKGGRIGGAQALIGSVLSVKPIIRVADGEVEAESRQRTRSRALRYLVDHVSRDSVERLAVMHAEAPDVAEFCTQLGEALPGVETALVGSVGPVIGSHCGPGATGVAYVVS